MGSGRTSAAGSRAPLGTVVLGQVVEAGGHIGLLRPQRFLHDGFRLILGVCDRYRLLRCGYSVEIKMKRYVEYEIDGGGTIVVEVEETEPGLVPATPEGKLIAKSERSFGAVLDSVRPAAEKLVSVFRDLAQRPQEIEVEFGLSLGLEAGALIASGSTNASFKVKLKWVQPPERSEKTQSDKRTRPK